MAAPPNTGMKKTEYRKLLTRSKEEPVTCAVGQGDAGGLMLLDKRKPGRALETALKAEFPDARNTRFGTAFVDVDDNPKLVKLTLNKPVTGMAKRLIKTLKGTGFNKVIIVLEDGSVMEQFEEEDLEVPVEDGDAAPANAAPAPPPAPPPPPPPAPAADTPADKAAQGAALIARLKELSGRIPAASRGDAARLEELTKLARMAGVEIKTGNLTYATNSLAQLETLLGAAPPPPPPAPPPPPSTADTAARVAELAAALKELVPKIAGAAAGDAARLATLSKLAKDANVEIKTGNLTYAANTIERLRTAMEPEQDVAPAQDGAIPASRIAWTNMRKEVAAEVERLGAALGTAYAGQAFAGEIDKRFRSRVGPLLDRFDDRLDGALDDLAKAPPAQRKEYAADALSYARDYRSFAEADPFLAALDDNPFVPLQIRSRAMAALTQVENALERAV